MQVVVANQQVTEAVAIGWHIVHAVDLGQDVQHQLCFAVQIKD